MKIQNLIQIVLVTLFLAACGNKETPLSAEQKSQLKEVGSSVNSAVSAPGSASTAVKKSTTSAFGLNEFFKATESSSGLKTQLAARLESNCKIEQPDRSKEVDLRSFNMGWNVSGPQCPISMSVNMSGGASSGSGDVSLSFKYAANDEEYKKLADVVAVEISGRIKGSQNEASIDIDGKIVSLKHGDIAIKITGSGSSNSGEVHVNITMKDFTAHLKIQVDGNGKQKYELNGEEVTASEMQAYMN